MGARIVDEPTDALLQRLFVSQGAVPLGFELFPPRSAELREALWTTVDRLSPVAEAGFSVTMGAGGSTRAGTHDTAVEVARRSGRPVTAHLTALGLSKDEALGAADALWGAGITRILALRGDRPRHAPEPLPAGFDHASDLVAALAARHDFEITVAAYPEKHPEAETLDGDIEHLKEKLDAGAKAAICQFVLDPAAYGRFLETCGRHGIDAPIVPGVMPLEGWTRVRSFAVANGTGVPDWLDRLFAKGEETPELMPYLSAVATVEHARRLIAYGAPWLHVYAMNRWPLPLALARLLGR
ncbi:methylenetetrahydrofolate reductase [Jannaschia seohaensis]|uniref:Methylenetetrahydrofolate reductase n=1 Tax=Jannaschia seohaensis TaxID=475081 RepID=A0A2Y9B1C2_9RHOB|nr:methylenetetrahydrofolate reductase [Jannaschia seohaensis]PWJ14986.1 methylenetetrahydrofolate reductase (NADPH) [Jannaschia seohaensis]SSA49835.1 methylenetetrahydrofolate reductase (NADPH) [Jannaschia seohaensis]